MKREFNECNTSWHGSSRLAGFEILNRDFTEAIGEFNFWDELGKIDRKYYLIIWQEVQRNEHIYYWYDLETMAMIRKRHTKNMQLVGLWEGGEAD